MKLSDWKEYWKSLTKKQQSMHGLLLANEAIAQLESENEVMRRICNNYGYTDMMIDALREQNISDRMVKPTFRTYQQSKDNDTLPTE